MTKWIAEQLEWLGVVDLGGVSEGDILTLEIGTPAGKLSIMGEVTIEGKLLRVGDAHIQGDGGPNSVGRHNLKVLAEFVLERIECDEAIVEGAVRTTGANPGHRPRAFRFTRQRRDEPGP